MGSEVIEKQVVYTGKKFKLELLHLVNEAGQRHVKEIVVHPGAAVILPFVAQDRILLIRNRRMSINQLLLELPAGTLDKNEDPINCAGRELIEETGYVAQRLKPLGNFFTSPGIMNERIFAFAAYDLKFQGQRLEAGEEIEVAPYNLDDAINMIGSGEIHDGKTIATLLMYDRFFRKP